GLPIPRTVGGAFACVRTDGAGGPKPESRSAAGGWQRLANELKDLARPYALAEQRWDSPITARLARRSVAAWLDEVRADAELRATAAGLRGFFLADPEELSLIALL